MMTRAAQPHQARVFETPALGKTSEICFLNKISRNKQSKQSKNVCLCFTIFLRLLIHIIAKRRENKKFKIYLGQGFSTGVPRNASKYVAKR